MSEQNQDPTVTLAIPLSVVNYILQAIATRPYGEVKVIIEEVTRQAQEQLKSDEGVANGRIDLPKAD